MASCLARINGREVEEELVEIDKRFRLPKRFTGLRKEQLRVAELAKDYFESGVDVVIVEAPVGFGKSIMCELTRQLLGSRMVYVAPHIQLQEQFIESLGGSLIKGRRNYPHSGPGGESKFPRETCADCLRKALCGEDGCEYRWAKEEFEAAEVGVTNFSFWLSGANYLNMFKPGSITETQRKELGGCRPNKWIDDYLTVFDEADCTEKLLLDHLEVYVSVNGLRAIGQEAGLRMSVPIPPIRDFAQWPCWWSDVREFVDKALKKHGNPNPKDIKSVRWVARIAKLKLALAQVECDWIYDPQRSKGKAGTKTGDAYAASLKPIIVGEIGKTKLWDHCGRTVATSGTIINSDIWSEETGLDKSGKSYEFIQVGSNWDRFRRSVHRVPGLEVSKSDYRVRWNKQPFWDKLIGDIVWVLSKYPDERTLIHGVSHELSEDIGKELHGIFGDRIVVHQGDKKVEKKSYWDRDEGGESDKSESGSGLGFGLDKKDSALQRYLAREGSVLVTASAGRGVDLPDDLCRNIIIVKSPWGNIKDRRTEARLRTQTGKMWYYVNTCRDILQYCGRGMRHKEDWVRIFVLDDTFDRIVDCRGLLPEYFQKSIRGKEDYMSRY